MAFKDKMNSVKDFFTRSGKKNLIIACAVILIGAAVWLNWSFFSKDQNDGYTYSGMSFWFPVSEEEWMGYSEHVEYDDQERRIKKTVWLDDEVDTVITYAYNADGKLISETHTTADGQTVTYYYIYQSILVYNFDAQ
jgi:YD repeat-containing protein